MKKQILAGVLESEGYVVGQSNASSGLYLRQPDGEWIQRGWKSIRCFGLTTLPGNPDTIFMAAGNGVLRSTDAGETWRVTTGWQITEVLHICVDPFDHQKLMASTSYGMWTSPDLGDTWFKIPSTGETPSENFTKCMCPDQDAAGRWFAGTEAGLVLTQDGGASWKATGPEGIAIRSLRQSAVTSSIWIMATERGGFWRSENGGREWNLILPFSPEKALYTANFGNTPDEMACGGYRTGFFVSSDAGTTWSRNAGPYDGATITALLKDDEEENLWWVGTAENGLYRFQDSAWQFVGLETRYVSNLITR